MQHFTAVKADKREAFHESQAKIHSKHLRAQTGSDIVAPACVMTNPLAHFRVSCKRMFHHHTYERLSGDLEKQLDALPTGPGTPH